MVHGQYMLYRGVWGVIGEILVNAGIPSHMLSPQGINVWVYRSIAPTTYYLDTQTYQNIAISSIITAD